jgi:hypothetical protein
LHFGVNAEQLHPGRDTKALLDHVPKGTLGKVVALQLLGQQSSLKP